jgi:hypothetical protein
MLKMNVRSVLAIVVCVVCFFMGYLFYAAVTMISDFVIGRISPCEDTIAACANEKPAR